MQKRPIAYEGGQYRGYRDYGVQIPITKCTTMAMCLCRHQCSTDPQKLLFIRESRLDDVLHSLGDHVIPQGRGMLFVHPQEGIVLIKDMHQ